jgi:isocitrate lyase
MPTALARTATEAANLIDSSHSREDRQYLTKEISAALSHVLIGV